MVESQTLPGRHTQNTPNVPPATTLLSMDVSPRVPLGSQCCVYIHVVCGSLETNHPFHCWCEIVSAGEFSKTRHMNIDTASSHHPPWQSPDKPDTFFAHRRVLYDGRTIALRLHTHTHTHVLAPAPTCELAPAPYSRRSTQPANHAVSKIILCSLCLYLSHYLYPSTQPPWPMKLKLSHSPRISPS